MRFAALTDFGGWTIDVDMLRRVGQARTGDGLALRVEGPIVRLQGPETDQLVRGRRAGRLYIVGMEDGGEARMAGRG